MNLKDLQLLELKDKATNNFLSKGILPTSTNIQSYIDNEIRNKTLGSSFFSPHLINQEEVSNKELYNKDFESIYNDLYSLYYVDKYINNELLSMFQLFDNEKKKCLSLLTDMQIKLDDLVYKLEDENVFFSYTFTFNNFEKFDFEEYFSTSYINLLSMYASNDIKISDTLDISKSKISLDVLSPNSSTLCLEDINGCINHSVTDIWLQQFISSSNGVFEITLTITLDEIKEANTLVLQLNSSRKIITYCDLILEDDSEFKLNEITSYHECDWNFGNKRIKEIRIHMKKLEADSNNGLDYIYYFGIKKIDLFLHIYELESKVITKVFKDFLAFSQIKLIEESSKPYGTSINHYLGFKYKDENNYSWIGIKPNEWIELNLLASYKEFLTNSSNNYGKERDDGLFILSDMIYIPIESSVNMSIGVDSWAVREIDSNDSIKDVYYKPISKFVKDNTIKYKVIKNTTTLYSIYVYCKDRSYNLTSVFSPDSDLISFVYVNSSPAELTDKLNIYNIRLNLGWNKIEILSINKTENNLYYIFNCYLKEISDLIVATKETELIDYYDLLYNKPVPSYNCYSIRDNAIIVNYNPIDLDIINYLTYCFDKFDLFSHSYVRLMSVFNSCDENLTPKLYNLKLLFGANPTTDIGNEYGDLYDGMFFVKFVDWDDKELLKTYVMEGMDAVPPQDPTREGYVFIGWDKPYTNVKKSIIVKALYEIATFKVIWKDYDKTTVLKEEIVEWDKDGNPPDMTGKYIEFDYVFYQFKDEDGNEIEKIKGDKGSTITAPEAPEKEGYDFVEWVEDDNWDGDKPPDIRRFVRWSEDWHHIKEDKIIYALYDDGTAHRCVFTTENSKVVLEYKDKDGNVIERQNIPMNGESTPPQAPQVEGYEFVEWQIDDKWNTPVDPEETDEILEEKYVFDGEEVIPPNDPEIIGKQFLGWEIDN